MATQSKKKQVDKTINDAGRRVKSATDKSSSVLKRGSHATIDATRQAKNRVRSAAKSAVEASGKQVEKTGRKMRKAA